MRERHVQQAQHQRDPRRRQLDAARKARPRSYQDRHLERAEAGEIGRHPFVDQMQQFAEIEILREARSIPIRKASRSRPPARRRRTPPSAAPAASPRDRHSTTHRARRRRQHQAEDESAVQVRPQRHQRQQPEGRRFAALACRHQAIGPGQHHRQHQHVRPRQKMRVDSTSAASVTTSHRSRECGGRESSARSAKAAAILAERERPVRSSRPDCSCPQTAPAPARTMTSRARPPW